MNLGSSTRPHAANRQHCIRWTRGFTLIEVILALVIALGLLVVALYFYSQAANLRNQLLDETDRLAALRLVMDRLSSELRSALQYPDRPFTGDLTHLSFVTVAPPLRIGGRRDTNSPLALPTSDLRWVAYHLGKSLDGTNEVVQGLFEDSRPLHEMPRERSAVGFGSSVESTNAPVSGGELISDAIRLFRLRYWDGSTWLNQWNSSRLPGGVEVILGVDPAPDEQPLAELTGEIFRRVIFLSEGRFSQSTLEIPDPSSQPRPSLPTP